MSNGEGEAPDQPATVGEQPRAPEPEPIWIRHAVPAAFIAWATVLVVGGIGWRCGWGADFGTFGDAFGVVTGLLTALALLASVHSIGLQRDELAATREE